MLIKVIGLILILTTIFSFSKESFANDSSSHPTATGIEFIKNNDISIEKETLYLNERSVEVEYEFYNHSSKEVIVPMAFPLPPLDPPLEYYNEPKAWNFRVFIGDKEYKDIKLAWRALVYYVDKALILKRLGISVDKHTDCLNQSLSQENQELLIKEGLALRLPEPESCLSPNWIVQAVYLWEAKFPPKRTTKVKHTYDQWPGTWSCVPKEIEGSYYDCGDGNKEIEEARNKFGRVPLDTYFYEYVIHTGGNWRGPIKRFIFKAQGPNDSMAFVRVPFPIKRESDNRMTADVDNYKPSSRTDVEKLQRTKGLTEMDDSVIWFSYIKNNQ